MKYPIQRKRRLFRNKRVRRDLIRKPANPRIAVPSFFTLMNLFCGFLSIISVSNGDYELGAWLIVIAGLFDALDGLMARLANATSEFGMELDSISDVVSFGVAPGFLIYNTFNLHEMEFVGIILSALPPLCGAVRLARFNVNAKYGANDDEFSGLPIPAQAIILGAFYLAFKDNFEFFDALQNGINSVLIPVVILASFLMVSAVPFDKLPRFDRNSLQRNKGKFVLFLFYLLLILVFRENGLMVVFLIFILKGLVVGAGRFWKQAFVEENENYEFIDRY